MTTWEFFDISRALRGFAKLKKFKKSKKKLDRAQPTHPPPYPNIFFFLKPISDMARTLKSQLLITYRQNTSHYAHTTWVPIPHTGNNITTTMYRRKSHSASEMRHLVNRTAIHVLSQNHRIQDKMMHACTSRGATCTVKQGRIVQTQNFIFGRFSNFFLLSKWDLDPPTSKLFLDFWNFFNFAKPLNWMLRENVSRLW